MSDTTSKKMNPEVKKIWVEALRSGEYEQCKGRLCKIGYGHRYCCLGVLTDLAIKNGVKVEVYEQQSDGCGGLLDSYAYKTFDNCSDYLPESVMNWAELSESSPAVYDNDECEHIGLDSLNDNGFTFEEIASLIETQL